MRRVKVRVTQGMGMRSLADLAFLLQVRNTEFFLKAESPYSFFVSSISRVRLVLANGLAEIWPRQAQEWSNSPTDGRALADLWSKQPRMGSTPPPPVVRHLDHPVGRMGIARPEGQILGTSWMRTTRKEEELHAHPHSPRPWPFCALDPVIELDWCLPEGGHQSSASGAWWRFSGARGIDFIILPFIH